MIGKPWVLFVSQNSEWLPFFSPFRSEWPPLGSPWDRNFDALSWFEPPSSGVKKSTRRTREITQWIDQKNVALRHLETRICFSRKENCTSQKCTSSNILGTLIFALYLPPSAVQSSNRTKKHRRIDIRVFGTPWPILRLRWSRFRFGICHKNSKFYNVLSVSVVLSVTVESVIESVML